MTERSMARIVKINNVYKHPNADTLDICEIGGWKVVTRLGEYKTNDLAIYCEIDSWIPTKIAPFLSKNKKPHEYNGVEGERLKTVKLRKQISQGLLLPLYTLDSLFSSQNFKQELEEGIDVSDLLNIQKWEPPVSAQLSGKSRGNFPHFLRKTDQKRVQNLSQTIKNIYADDNESFEVTIKLDGSSMTVYYFENDVGVTSRNIDLKVNPESNNSFIRTAYDKNIIEALRQFCTRNNCNYALQGELIGEGIQGNKEGISGHQFYLFDVFDIDKQEYLPPYCRLNVFTELVAIDNANIFHVPVIESEFKLQSDKIDDLLSFADGPSLHSNIRKGLVFKSNERQFSFKVISNKWLLKYE